MHFWSLDLENSIENFKPDLMITCNPSVSCLTGEGCMGEQSQDRKESEQEGRKPYPISSPQFP
jgi:hypothetical protein